jgi:hypothetical protein
MEGVVLCSYGKQHEEICRLLNRNATGGNGMLKVIHKIADTIGKKL